MTDDIGPQSPSTDPRGWSLSAFLVLLATLSIGITALAGSVSSDPTADEFATATYGLLSAGVVARVVEYTLGETVGDVLGRGRAECRTVLDTLSPDSSSRYRLLATDVRTLDGRSRGLRERMRRRVGRVPARLPLADERMSDRFSLGEIRRGIRITLLLTLTGGSLLIAWWWYDPTVVTSVAFYINWVLALSVLGGVYLVLAFQEG